MEFSVCQRVAKRVAKRWVDRCEEDRPGGFEYALVSVSEDRIICCRSVQDVGEVEQRCESSVTKSLAEMVRECLTHTIECQTIARVRVIGI